MRKTFSMGTLIMLDNNNLYDIQNMSEQLMPPIFHDFKLINEIIQLLPQPTFILNKQRKIILSNKLIHNLLSSTLLYNDYEIILDNYFLSEDIDAYIKWFLSFFNSSAPQKVLRLNLCHENMIKKIELAGNLINIENNYYILVILNDLTEFFENKVTRISSDSQRLKEALIIERNKSEFYLNISHDIRTPLNVILGTIQLTELTFKDLNKTSKSYEIMKRRINIIKQNCYRLLKLANNLIDISRLDAGYKSVQLCNCDIVSKIAEIVSSISEYAENRKITLTFKSQINELIVACDIDKIERIMFNLLSNAIRFTDENGFIEVNIFCDKKWVNISVQDSGIGIPPNKLKSIFRRFKQVNQELSTKSGGSGLGLSLVKSLVEMHKGNIYVESTLGQGSTFTIQLQNKKLPTKIVNDNNHSNYINIKPDLERIKIEFSDI